MPTLGTGEEIRFQGPGVLRRTAGVLTITTERLLFTHSTGAPRRREHLDLAVPIETIYSAEVERSLGKQRLVLVAHGRGYSGPARVFIELSRPPDLQQLISELVADRRRALEETEERERSAARPSVHVTVHPTPPTTRVMFRCPYCRTVYPELEGKCPSCGAAF
jgi:hypothetical protein